MEKYVSILFMMLIYSCIIATYGYVTIDNNLSIYKNLKINETSFENITQIHTFFKNKDLEIIKNENQPRIRTKYLPFSFTKENNNESDCESASDEFPGDLFTIDEKRKGAIILHFILAIYCFTLLAVVCNDYFLPAVELICEKLNLSRDVAAATFMAIATSAPEFFVNLVGTFITKNDIGVGTIIGSSMFNTLGVAALGGLATNTHIRIDWWPLTRDSIIYVFTITTLIIMTRDERIQWYEAMILLIFYILYFFIMWQNKQIHDLIIRMCNKFRRNNSNNQIFTNNETSTTEIFHTSVKDVNNLKHDSGSVTFSIESEIENRTTKELKKQESFLDDEPLKFCTIPNGNIWIKVWWLFSWPVRLLLKLTIPDCRKHHWLFPFTFIMCVVWIGTNSYLVSWMVSVIGDTIKIPDFVMGLTFLAAGGCLPEAISIVLVARRGMGGMGVSNSLGANTLDILLCLGLPWFIKTMVSWSEGNPNWIEMNSDSIFYTIIALILAVLVLFVTISVAGFQLNKKVGIVLILFYAIFLSVAITLEMLLVYEGKVVSCFKN